METCYPIQNIMSRIKFKVKFKDISFNKDGHTPLPPLSSLVNVYGNENQDKDHETFRRVELCCVSGIRVFSVLHEDR